MGGGVVDWDRLGRPGREAWGKREKGLRDGGSPQPARIELGWETL